MSDTVALELELSDVKDLEISMVNFLMFIDAGPSADIQSNYVGPKDKSLHVC